MSQRFDSSSKMLLCIDDNQGVLAYERSLFERSGYIVVTADSAQEGFRLATMSEFDAVVLDYHMAELNGHRFASEMRRLKPRTPVVMFSNEDVIPEETRKLVDAVVSKSEAIRELLPTITRLFSPSSEA